MDNKMTTNKQAKKLAKPIKAWTIIGKKNDIKISWLFSKKPVPQYMSQNERIARVEIREVEK